MGYEGVGYLTDDSGTSRRFATHEELAAVEVGGVGGIEDVPGLEDALAAKAETPLAIADVTDLQDALDDKLESPIAISDVTGLQTALDGLVAANVAEIADTPNATAEDAADKVNEVIAALIAAGLMDAP